MNVGPSRARARWRVQRRDKVFDTECPKKEGRLSWKVQDSQSGSSPAWKSTYRPLHRRLSTRLPMESRASSI